MAYLVKKIINKHPYYYLKESKRYGNKVNSKNIAYFGKKKPTKKEIEEKLKSVEPKKEIKEEVVVPKEIQEKPQQDKAFKPEQKTQAMNINDMAIFCKKKGFIFQNSEIYGGMAGFFDYGHLGVELKNNIKNEWWKYHVQSREDIVGMDGSIITHPKVWVASGHVANFSDLMLTTKKSKIKIRADQFIEEKLGIAADGMKADEINELIISAYITSKDYKGALEYLKDKKNWKNAISL